MARNGSGTYNLATGNPVSTGTTISSTWANNTLADIASALTQSVSKDGQTPMVGNLNMSGNKITGLANASASGDAVSLGRLDETDASSLIGYLPAGVGAVATTVQDTLRESVTLKGFGAKGDGVADDTTAMALAVYFAKTFKKTLNATAGIYRYSTLPGLDETITIVGDSSDNTVFKYIGTGDALVLGTASGFRQGINISGITIEGNAEVDRIIVAIALA